MGNEAPQIKVRQLNIEEIEQSLHMSSYAFQFTIPKEDWEEAISNEVPHEVWGAFDGEQLVAKVRVRPLRIYLQGKIVDMGGIAAVATWPEYRRGGIVGSLLIHALSVMRESGMNLSFLAPFSFAFYRRYGWETYVERKKFTVETEYLPRIEPSRVPGQVRRIAHDVNLLSLIYEQYASTYNGTLNRSIDWFKGLLEDKKGHVAVYRDLNGEPNGYIHYELKNREFLLHEFITLNHEAKLGLWRYISNHDSMINKVILFAPSEDALPFLLDNPRIQQEIVPYFMARIVDVEKLVEQYSFLASADRIAHWSDDRSVQLNIHIKDEHAMWNDGLWELTVHSNGSATMKRSILDGSGAGATLSCDIQTLSTLMMGYMSTSYLYEIGRLQGDAELVLLLEAIVPKRATFLNDFF